MKDLTKIYIDLSKCTEVERKHIFSMLPEQEFDNQYRIDPCHFHLSFDENDQQWWVYNSTVGKTELTYPEFIKLFEGGEEENPYRPMTEFPPITEGEQHSKIVLVYDEDLDDCDLGFYNFDTEKWMVLGDFQMNLICWRHIDKPMYEDVQEYPTILTD